MSKNKSKTETKKGPNKRPQPEKWKVFVFCHELHVQCANSSQFKHSVQKKIPQSAVKAALDTCASLGVPTYSVLPRGLLYYMSEHTVPIPTRHYSETANDTTNGRLVSCWDESSPFFIDTWRFLNRLMCSRPNVILSVRLDVKLENCGFACRIWFPSLAVLVLLIHGVHTWWPHILL